MLLITADNVDQHCGPESLVNGLLPSKGRKPRDFATHPYGGLGFAAPSDVLIPRNEYASRIKDRREAGSSISAIAQAAGVKVYHQGSTNYCWANAPVKGIELLQVAAGQDYVPLSPASVAAPIKNYRNEGGWGTQAAKFIAERGASTAKLWPANSLDRRFNTHAANAERSKYQLDEWYDIPPQSFAHMATHLLLGRVVPIGLNWWTHEVLAVELVDLGGGKFGALIWNSHGESFGEKGLAVLDEKHATPDDALAMCVATG